jgi:hypothetical protein
LLKNGRVVPNWGTGVWEVAMTASGSAVVVVAPLSSDFRFNGFLFPGGDVFRKERREKKMTKVT